MRMHDSLHLSKHVAPLEQVSGYGQYATLSKEITPWDQRVVGIAAAAGYHLLKPILYL